MPLAQPVAQSHVQNACHLVSSCMKGLSIGWYISRRDLTKGTVAQTQVNQDVAYYNNHL
jgi:hypothetical protein